MVQLEMLKEEFKSKFQKTNPVLTNLTIWCLGHEYEDRPDFIDLESQIEKIEYAMQNNHFVSEIIPIESSKTFKVRPNEKSGFTPKKRYEHYEIKTNEKYVYLKPGKGYGLYAIGVGKCLKGGK
jgi:hypothetical protein